MVIRKSAVNVTKKLRDVGMVADKSSLKDYR
jgi:hypothetical protein